MGNQPSLIHLLHRASQVAEDRLTRELGDVDVTPRQLAVLGAIEAHDGASQTDIVVATGVDRSTVADMVRRLLKRGLVSRKRTGACTALVWSDADQRYHCAMVKAPQQALPSMPLWLVPATRALARRWIASGSGCDCNLEVSAAPVDALPGPVADTQARAHDARVDPAC